MGNKLIPQPVRKSMVNSSVPPEIKEPPQLLSPSCFSRIWFYFSWMLGWSYNQEPLTVLEHDSLPNIIANPDFSVGNLQSWNCIADAEGLVIVNKSPFAKSERHTYALVYIRNKWQGLKQEINVSPDVTYVLHARVGLLGLPPSKTAEVQATLVLETEGSSDIEIKIFAKVDATSNAWTNLEGSFELKAKYHHVHFHLEVVDPVVDKGVNLIVSWVDLHPLPHGGVVDPRTRKSLLQTG